MNSVIPPIPAFAIPVAAAAIAHFNGRRWWVWYLLGCTAVFAVNMTTAESRAAYGF